MVKNGLFLKKKCRGTDKIEKRIPSGLIFLVTKIKQIMQFIYQKNVVKKNMLIYY